MSHRRRTIPIVAVLALGAAFLACEGEAPITEPPADEVVAPSFARGSGAEVQEGTFSGPFPPPPEIPFAPVSAPCLGLGEPLQMSGTWSGRFRIVVTPTGHFHLNELIDYSEVPIRLGGLTWLPGPGATEAIVDNGPLSGSGSATVIRHELHNRYISQDGLSDLHVTHRIKIVVGPDGTLRHFEGIPPSFSATCIGSGA